MNVIFEDNHLLVVNKPAGLATMGAEEGADSVHNWATTYLKKKYNKPGNVFVGIVSRLDALTSGVLVLARTSKAASRLSIQFGGPGKNKKVTRPATKTYLAVVEGGSFSDSGLSESGTLVDQVYKDDSHHRMRVASVDRKDAKQARLSYRVLHKYRQRTLVAVRLHSGRKHQIRLQFGDRGHPIVGDQNTVRRKNSPPGLPYTVGGY